MATESSEIQKRILRLLRNIILLFFVMLSLRMIFEILGPYISFEVMGFIIGKGTLLNASSLIFTIYFGYGILTDAKYLLDVANKSFSLKLEEKGQITTKTIAYNLTTLIALVLIYEALVPFLESISGLGPILAMVVNLILLVIGFFTVYNLAQGVYFLIKNRIDQLVEMALKKRKEEKEP